MSTYKPTVFNQISRLMRDHITPFIGQLNKYAKVMNCSRLSRILLYAQIEWKQSLRDIETWLLCHESKLYHTLWMKKVARSTISYWNNKTDSELFEKTFYAMFQKYKSAFVWEKNNLWISTVALDSSIVSLCLKTYDRAKYKTTKWWIRLHVWMDVDTYMPRFTVITDAKKAENLIARDMINGGYLRQWEMIVFDRYYIDFGLWKTIDEKEAYFVTRTKDNTDYVAIESHTISEKNILQDSTIELMWYQWQKKYKKKLRLVRFYDEKSDREFEYITHNFELSAGQIADIYKHRWKIEEFFRWIKQNLKIKSFLGTSENAVKNQIRIAMIYYLILQYLRSIASLWRKQLLKLSRLIRWKCMSSIGLSEIFAMCKSKKSLCLSQPHAPPNSLFDF